MRWRQRARAQIVNGWPRYYGLQPRLAENGSVLGPHPVVDPQANPEQSLSLAGPECPERRDLAGRQRSDRLRPVLVLPPHEEPRTCNTLSARSPIAHRSPRRGAGRPGLRVMAPSSPWPATSWRRRRTSSRSRYLASGLRYGGGFANRRVPLDHLLADRPPECAAEHAVDVPGLAGLTPRYSAVDVRDPTGAQRHGARPWQGRCRSGTGIAAHLRERFSGARGRRFMRSRHRRRSDRGLGPRQGPRVPRLVGRLPRRSLSGRLEGPLHLFARDRGHGCESPPSPIHARIPRAFHHFLLRC